MKILVVKMFLWVLEWFGFWVSDEWWKIGNLKVLYLGMFELIIMILVFLIVVYLVFILWNINYYIYKMVIRVKFVKKYYYMYIILCFVSVLLN